MSTRSEPCLPRLRAGRTLTDKARQNYEESKIAYKEKLRQSERRVLLLTIQNIESSSNDKELISVETEHYVTLSNEFCLYLDHIKTEDSENEKYEQLKLKDLLLHKVENYFHDSNQRQTGSKDSRHSHRSSSNRSHGSRGSRNSHISERLVLTQAKVQAARTKLKYAEQELTLRKQRAAVVETESITLAASARKKVEIESDLQLLKEKKELDAMKAEADVLEVASCRTLPSDDLPEIDRTADFVKKYSQDPSIARDQSIASDHQRIQTNRSQSIASDHQRIPTNRSQSIASDHQPIPTNQAQSIASDHHRIPTNRSQSIASDHQRIPTNQAQSIASDHKPIATHQSQSIASDHKPIAKNQTQSTTFDQTATVTNQTQSTASDQKPYATNQRQSSASNQSSSCPSNQNTPSALNADANTFKPTPEFNDTLTGDFTRFLLKKDLLISRLHAFDDKPENYLGWKTSFKLIMKELQASCLEELDLMTKYLGPQSGKQAKTLRSAYGNAPERAVEVIWQRLEERYGAPELVAEALKRKLASFPNISPKDAKQLYSLSDIVSEIECVKEDPKFMTLFSYFDSSSGVSPIVTKLPHFLQEKWVNQASNFKSRHNVAHPPFTFFASFIREMAKIRNDPSFCFQSSPSSLPPMRRTPQAVSVRKTEADVHFTGQTKPVSSQCPVHGTNHSLNECRSFKSKPMAERQQLVKEKGICFRCCDSSNHRARDCRSSRKCGDCGSNKHPTALHINIGPQEKTASQRQVLVQHGGERKKSADSRSDIGVTNICTEVCGPGFNGKSCAKIVLVRVHHRDQPCKSFEMYAIIDDQSNRTLARSALFDRLGLQSKIVEYALSSCGGHTVASGRIADGCIVETVDGSCRLELPELLECNDIPNVREEIPSPDVAAHHPHLREIAEEIPPLKEEAQILMLIGRDLIEAHHVSDQRIGGKGAPYAQKLGLGWVIVGETCLGKIHRSDYVNVNKTCLLQGGRSSIFKPCENRFEIFEATNETKTSSETDPLFQKCKDDERPGLSVDDREFLKMMDSQFVKGPRGKWTAPLPFREDRPKLPNNREQAERRANILHKNLMRNPSKQQQFLTFMQRTFDNGHAEKAPQLEENEECWYLPVFGVHHPQKPNEIRCVFDSSAKHRGISLNDVLLTGPDLTNSLLGILLRFRKEDIAIMADIEQMFYSFYVQEEHRNFLRFMWYEDNEPEKPMIEYRMCVHVFGNSPSPAVATYGLRKTVETSEADVKDFVNSDFYVDDGLTSRPTVSQTVTLMKKTQLALKEGGLRLHKIASNEEEVMTAFPNEDLAKGLKNLDLQKDDLPIQRSLGLRWELMSDSFCFDILPADKPYTRRGVLSVINSIYDPIGFLAPVTVQGRLILQSLMAGTGSWDEPLPAHLLSAWESWKESLRHLSEIRIPRAYSPTFSDETSRQIFMYSDASEKAIAASGYLVARTQEDATGCSFLLGKAKVAPSKGHTIPRLELCAAVLSVELAEILSEQLGVPLQNFRFHTDSRVVLGYISNRTRRFHTYVSNRVERIRRSSRPDQWKYIPTDHNPADCATRGVEAKDFSQSMWLSGPRSCYLKTEVPEVESFPLIDPEQDKELRQDVNALKTEAKVQLTSWSERFAKFSSWRRLVESIARLKHMAAWFKKNRSCKGCYSDSNFKSVKSFHDAEIFVLKAVQNESFSKEVKHLGKDRPLPRDSPILKLDPYLDDKGLLKVGGRMHKSDLSNLEKNPVLISGKHHVATLLVRFHHEAIQHQGRHLTEGALRSAGLWITGGRRLISSVIHGCVKCKKLRGKLEYQKMADLPEDRLKPTPPFTFVGVDAFGPWNIVTRRTRGGQANSKRWCILFTCLIIRAIHVEVVEEMSSSAFINALRRFISLRGKVQEFRSDRGTNFVGACEELQIPTVRVEQGEVADFLYKSGAVWKFNPPHSSHMGGSWERMIGLVRRILESMLSQERNLTHDVLVTLMAEACAIVNSRPLVPVSCDSDVPEVLSPATLLTFKSDNVEYSAGQVDLKDTYKKQWKHVKHLADVFWHRWRREFLQSLQQRQKWQDNKPNLGEGDVVLLKDNSVGRMFWPLGRISEVYPSSDGCVRKVKVRVAKDNAVVEYIRPAVEVVLLLRND